MFFRQLITRTLSQSSHLVRQGLNREVKLVPISKQAHTERYIHSNTDFPAPLKPVKTILVLKGGELSLWQQNMDSDNYTKSFSQKVTNSQYDIVKQVSHMPLLIQTLLLSSDIKDADVLKRKKAELNEIYKEIVEIIKTIDVSSEESKNQQVVLQKTKEFLEMLLTYPEDEEINLQAEIEKFFASVRPTLEYNKKLGAKIQLSRMDEIINAIRKRESFDLNETRVIIVGPIEPRKGLIERQYFLSLYHQERCDQGFVYYAECLPKDIDKIDIEQDLIAKFLVQAEYDKSSYLEEKFSKVEVESSDEEKVKAKTILSVPSSSKHSLKKLNDKFLKAHSQAAKDALQKIKTVVIYKDDVLSLWKRDSQSNQFQMVANSQVLSTKEIEELIQKWESEHEVELDKNRIVVCGLRRQKKVSSVTNYFSRFYQDRLISKAPLNDFVYHIESIPKNESLAEHVIENMVASSELDKEYGKALIGDGQMMFSDVMAQHAPGILSVFHKCKVQEVAKPSDKSSCLVTKK